VSIRQQSQQLAGEAAGPYNVVGCVADIKSTTSKIKYYETEQYSTIKNNGFTTSTEKTKKY